MAQIASVPSSTMLRNRSVFKQTARRRCRPEQQERCETAPRADQHPPGSIFCESLPDAVMVTGSYIVRSWR